MLQKSDVAVYLPYDHEHHSPCVVGEFIRGQRYLQQLNQYIRRVGLQRCLEAKYNFRRGKSTQNSYGVELIYLEVSMGIYNCEKLVNFFQENMGKVAIAKLIMINSEKGDGRHARKLIKQLIFDCRGYSFSA